MSKLLQIFAILLVNVQFIKTLPVDGLLSSLDDEDFDSENYDIYIDQRQNGTQNFRIKVSGLTVAIPDDRNEPTPEQTPILELEQFANLLSPTSNQGTNDLADLNAFFDWKKKTSAKKNSATDTQSRTKDIPTDSQLAEPTKPERIKEVMREERRKYKLLVGEKYIIPIIRFLKKQMEEVKE